MTVFVETLAVEFDNIEAPASVAEDSKLLKELPDEQIVGVSTSITTIGVVKESEPIT